MIFVIAWLDQAGGRTAGNLTWRGDNLSLFSSTGHFLFASTEHAVLDSRRLSMMAKGQCEQSTTVQDLDTKR